MRALAPAVLLALPAALPAALAAAEDFDARRLACEPVMTAVKGDCGVTNQYLCPDGSHYFEGYDPDWLGTSPDGLWLREVNGPDYGLGPSQTWTAGGSWTRVLEVRREFSLRELLADGRTGGDYLMEVEGVHPAPRPGRMTFDARLTDKARILGGVAFRLAALRMEEEIGPEGVPLVAEGFLLIDEARGLMVTDYATVAQDGVTLPADRVVDVLGPGEPGFMATGAGRCGGLLSWLGGRAHG